MIWHCIKTTDLCSQEVGSGNTSQKSDEDDFVKVEDLPLQLSVMSEVSGTVFCQGICSIQYILSVCE